MNKPFEIIRRWWVRLWLKNVDPVHEVRADYETLIRLARRCAYDFSHASDFTPRMGDPTYWLQIDWNERAESWIGLFSKGNPGKDYRIDLVRDLDLARINVGLLIDVLRENGLEDKIPAHLTREVPF